MARKKVDWFKLPYVRDDIAVCAVCKRGNYTMQRNKRHLELRENHEDCGDVCMGCYVTADECRERGCHNIAVENGLCRHHFLGEPWGDEDLREFVIQNQLYGGYEPAMPEPPGAFWGWSEMRKKIRGVQKRNGVVIVRNPWWHSPMYIRHHGKTNPKKWNPLWNKGENDGPE